MTEITQADRDAADQIMEAVDACGCKLCSMRACEAFARHRIEATETLRAENERLREALAKCVAVQIFPDGKGGHKVSASFANYKAANPLFILLTSYISDDRAALGDTK